MTRQKPLSTEELSERTGIPIGTFRYWRHAGIGPVSFKYGKAVRYRVEDVERWEQAQYEATRVGDEIEPS